MVIRQCWLLLLVAVTTTRATILVGPAVLVVVVVVVQAAAVWAKPPAPDRPIDPDATAVVVDDHNNPNPPSTDAAANTVRVQRHPPQAQQQPDDDVRPNDLLVTLRVEENGDSSPVETTTTTTTSTSSSSSHASSPDSSSSSSSRRWVEDWEESLARKGRVFLMNSLDQLYETLQRQQQQQQPAASHNKNDSIYWLVYVENAATTAANEEETGSTDSEACSFSLWPILEPVAEWLEEDDAPAMIQQQQRATTTTTRIRCAALSLNAVDGPLLQQHLGLQATPAVILVSATVVADASNNDNNNNNHKDPSNTVLLVYTGRLGTAQQLYDGVTHYFDVLQWTTRSHHHHAAAAAAAVRQSKPDSPPKSTTDHRTTSSSSSTTTTSKDTSITTLWDLPLPSFADWQRVHEFLSTNVPDRLWHRAARATAAQAIPVLSSSSTQSSSSSQQQQQVAEWLFRDETTTTTTSTDHDKNNNNNNNNNKLSSGFLRLVVQSRCSSTTDTDTDTSTSSAAPLVESYYHDMDVFAHAQLLRRNHLFVVVNNNNTKEDDNPCESSHVDVWDIPVQHYYNYTHHHNNNSSHENENHDGSRSSPPPFWTDPRVPHFRHELLSHNNSNTRQPSSSHARLVDFLINVCTDTVLWWDRQTVAPIAFGRHRRVHAVLFVDWHQYRVWEDGSDSNNTNDWVGWLDSSPHWRTQRAAIQEFRAACHQHRQSPAVDDDDNKNQPNAILDRDMVCLVVPSTEIRVLTTLGVDWWTPLDRAAVVTNKEWAEANSLSSGNSSSNPKEQLPALLITDQRYSGTRRYYNNESDERYHGYSGFIASFWQGQLQYEIKTSPRKTHTNQAGVRILTAESFEEELYSSRTTTTTATTVEGDDEEQQQLQQQQQQHALILFIAPTCGHCKRLLVIWNHLAQLLQHIGWNSFLTLYQVDVTENDVATTLNVTVDWLPDLYYLGSSTVDPTTQQQQQPTRDKTMIRYNHTDALGDGVGAVRDGTEILEWLVHLDEFANAERASQLLSDLLLAQHSQSQHEIKKQ